MRHRPVIPAFTPLEIFGFSWAIDIIETTNAAASGHHKRQAGDDVKSFALCGFPVCRGDCKSHPIAALGSMSVEPPVERRPALSRFSSSASSPTARGIANGDGGMVMPLSFAI